MSSNFKYISMNQKCRHLVFLKILSAVTPECVVDRLRRFNVYIWLLKPIYSQHKCQFMQNTFGNTGQRMDSIRISAQHYIHKGFRIKFFLNEPFRRSEVHTIV